MSWLSSDSDSSLQVSETTGLLGRFLLQLMHSAPSMPRHVAFIMDGNRRFARSHNLENNIEGHQQGFTKMTHVLAWCRDLCIPEVSVYAFSVENFKRSREEVDALLTLAREKLGQLLLEQQKLKENGVVVRVCGELHLLPSDLQELALNLEKVTKSNEGRRRLNICLAYTATAEIVHAMKRSIEEEGEELLSKSEADVEQSIEKRLYISSKVDLLIRTSGETRLSDFLLWQCCESTVIHFTAVLWPDFSVWHLFKAVLDYNRHRATLKSFLVQQQERLEAENNDECNNNYEVITNGTAFIQS